MRSLRSKRRHYHCKLPEIIQAQCTLIQFAFSTLMKHDLPVFALLIDADNVSREVIAPIIEEITRHARIAVRRVYGDFTTPNLASWRETLANHGIHPIQQYRNSVGKNASDSALIIDAMDLLHSRRFDGFCLVSSDGDFTRLATRIREDNLTVYGFGRQDAAKAFVQACDSYIYFDSLLAKQPPPDQNEIPAANSVPQDAKEPPRKKTTIQAPNLEKLKQLMLHAYNKVSGEDGWALISRVEQYIRDNHSEVNSSNYGAATFFKLLSMLEDFEISQRQQGNGKAQFCRPKPIIRKAATLPSRQIPAAHNKAQADAYKQALQDAVIAKANGEGWSKIADIRVYLHENGYRLENSGFESLESALKASMLFEMCDAGGTNKIFKLASKGALA